TASSAAQASGAGGTGAAGSGPQTASQLLTLITAAAGSTSQPGSGAAQSNPSLATSAGTASAATATTAADPQSAAAAARFASATPAPANPLSFMKSELRSPVGTAPWVDELGTHLTWMANRGLESASLQVSPPDLGPIEARISVHGGAATVWFGATHPDTRAALEQALPRLRAMFATQGLALADSGVFREAPRQAQTRPTSTSSVASIAALADAPPAASGEAARLGLVDLYA
ncbi:MAG: flagellar hook-length control protein FliK, partial [Steroidobacteraceae bacterium]